jgi:hypothetical protein
VASPICSAPQCDRPAHDGFLCVSCRDTLRRDLDSVPVLCVDLQVTIAKQDRLGDTDGRSTDERPLPLRLGPMEARRDLTDTLRAWADHVAQRRGVALASHEPARTAEWLSMHIGDIQDDPRAGDIADEIGYAVIVAGRAVDKPLQHQYVGPCDKCKADLYAHPKSKVVACRNVPCDAEYNVEERRDWLLEKVEDQLATAAELSRALPNLLQHPLSASAIRGYARRHGDKLPQKPPDARDPLKTPRYRVGDLLTLLHQIRGDEHRTAC